MLRGVKGAPGSHCLHVRVIVNTLAKPRNNFFTCYNTYVALGCVQHPLTSSKVVLSQSKQIRQTALNSMPSPNNTAGACKPESMFPLPEEREKDLCSHPNLTMGTGENDV